MARSFNGTTEFIELSSALATAYSVTLACWFNASSLVPSQSHILALSEAASFRALQLVIRSTGKVRARSSDSGGTANSAETAATVSTGTWNHIAGVWTGDADRTIYLNGANSVNNTGSITVGPLNFNRTTIGAWANSSTHVEFFPGSIAFVGIWTAALDAAEIAGLGKGISPLLVRPASLVGFLPLMGAASPEPSYKGTAFTLTGTGQSSNPLIYMPTHPRQIGTPSATTSYTLSAGAGSYAETGTNAGLIATRKMSAASGSYAQTGTAATLTYAAANTITVDPNTSLQTMVGWEATSQAGEDTNATTDAYPEYPSTTYPNYKSAILAAMADLGLNRLRVELLLSDINATGYDANGNNAAIQPSTASAGQFHYDRVRRTMDDLVIPFKTILAARGESLYITLCVVDFRPTGYKAEDTPSEYAFAINAFVADFVTRYGFKPNAIEAILEPDVSSNSNWNETKIANNIVAANTLLVSNGYTGIRWVAPSCTSGTGVQAYYAAMKAANASVTALLDEIGYHRYENSQTGINDANLALLAAAVEADGNHPAMLELIAATFQMLHSDLSIGHGTSWQQYTVTYPYSGATDDGSQYFNVNRSTWAVTLGTRTKYLRHYFKWIRSGAVMKGVSNSNSNYLGVPFRNSNGKYVVVVNCLASGTFKVSGLPAGTYGIRYTTGNGTSAPSAYDQPLTSQTVNGSQDVTVTMPGAGVVTVYDLLAVTFPADPGSYAMTGTTAAVRATRRITASAGSYAETGTAAGLRRAYTLSCGAGSYGVTGTAATLTYAPAHATYTLTATGGSYTETGTAASLVAARKMPASAGSYTTTGTVAALRAGLKVSASAGSYLATGSSVGLAIGHKVSSAAGSYAYSGTSANFAKTRRLAASFGSYSMTGTNANLIYDTSETIRLPLSFSVIGGTSGLDISVNESSFNGE